MRDENENKQSVYIIYEYISAQLKKVLNKPS